MENLGRSQRGTSLGTRQLDDPLIEWSRVWGQSCCHARRLDWSIERPLDNIVKRFNATPASKYDLQFNSHTEWSMHAQEIARSRSGLEQQTYVVTYITPLEIYRSGRLEMTDRRAIRSQERGG